MNDIKLENTKEEMILIVDENDNPIGQDLRTNMRKNNLIHRSSHIFVRNSNNKYIVQIRSMKKEYCPGYLDLATGGVVSSSDNSVKESAIRELKEEIGVDTDDIEFIGKKYYGDNNVRVYNYVYFLKYDGEFSFNDGEVQDILLLSEIEIIEKINKKEKITPDSTDSFLFLLNIIKK